TYISYLCTEIINSKRDSFEVARDIFKVSVDLEHPSDLSPWIELDDNIDWIVYDDKRFKREESEVRQMIIEEAERYLKCSKIEVNHIRKE
ncbi:hypothetical protein AB4Z21_38440, partial [Paenibacillus sp. MCAF20]